MQVNTYGVISITYPYMSFGARPFPLMYDLSQIIAPFWANHDVTNQGRVLYRCTEDASFLNRVGTRISAAFNTSFSPSFLLIATWDGVSEHSVDIFRPSVKVNTFPSHSTLAIISCIFAIRSTPIKLF